MHACSAFISFKNILLKFCNIKFNTSEYQRKRVGGLMEFIL